MSFPKIHMFLLLWLSKIVIKYSVKTLPLIGEYNDIWYPLINNFILPIVQSIKLAFYKNNDSSNEAKKFINLFEEN